MAEQSDQNIVLIFWPDIIFMIETSKMHCNGAFLMATSERRRKNEFD